MKIEITPDEASQLGMKVDYFLTLKDCDYSDWLANEVIVKWERNRSHIEMVFKLNLSRRVAGCLLAAGIDDMRNLATKTENDLLEVANLGGSSVRYIVHQLARKGVTLPKE